MQWRRHKYVHCDFSNFNYFSNWFGISAVMAGSVRCRWLFAIMFAFSVMLVDFFLLPQMRMFAKSICVYWRLFNQIFAHWPIYLRSIQLLSWILSRSMRYFWKVHFYKCTYWHGCSKTLPLLLLILLYYWCDRFDASPTFVFITNFFLIFFNCVVGVFMCACNSSDDFMRFWFATCLLLLGYENFARL